VCRLGWRTYRNSYYLSRKSGSDSFFVLEGEDLDDEGQPDTDIACVRAGHATLTPISIDRNRHEHLDALVKWLA
jgi:broad specificity polyphosphatase/5'/3'-nucleotidase SurE